MNRYRKTYRKLKEIQDESEHRIRVENPKAEPWQFVVYTLYVLVRVWFAVLTVDWIATKIVQETVAKRKDPK